MDRVILLKDYNGLTKGTELVYNNATDSFGFKEIEETIGDNVRYSISRKVSFTKPWVESLVGKLFEDPDAVKEISEHQQVISQYEEYIAALQSELNQIKNEV